MNTTRRHPRTLQEAFGPHASSDFGDRPRARNGAWFVVALALGLLGLVLVGIQL